MRRLPLRVRLTLGFAVGMAITLFVLGAVLRVRLGAELLRGVDIDLRSRAQVIAGLVVHQDAPTIPASGTLIDPDEAFAQVLDPTGRIVDTTPGVSAAPILTARQLPRDAATVFLTTRVHGVDDPVRLLAVPIRRQAGGLFVVVGTNLGDLNEAVGRATLLLAVLGPIALIVVSAAGWVLTGAALRPVERMRREAEAISVSELDRRLPVPPADDELSRLGSTLNAMLDRLEEAFAREGRFVDLASHELRTPLTVLKAELDLALARTRTPEEIERTLRRASTETDRLVRLAEDLTVLARMRGGRLPIRRVPVDLEAFVTQICTAYQARAEISHITMSGRVDAGAVTGTTTDATMVRMDPSRMRQAVECLLDNAFRLTPAGGRVDVTGTVGDGRARIEVRDTGPGLQAPMLDHGLEPFASETAADGAGEGPGLGLAIVRAVAAAHAGAVKLANAPDGGAVVAISFEA